MNRTSVFWDTNSNGSSESFGLCFNPTPVGLLSYQLLQGGGVFRPPIKTYLGTNLTQFFFGCSRENLISVWFGLFWLGKIQCWFELVRLGMVRFGLRQHPSEASVNISSRSNLFWLFQRTFSVGLVWYGIDWFGLAVNPNRAGLLDVA